MPRRGGSPGRNSLSPAGSPRKQASEALIRPENTPCSIKRSLLPAEEGSFFIRRKTSVNVFAAPDTIDDGGDHDREVNEDAAYAHKALRGGVQGAGDEFSHTVLLESLDCPPANIPESAFILPQQRQKVKAAAEEGGFVSRARRASCRGMPPRFPAFSRLFPRPGRGCAPFCLSRPALL